MIPKQGKKDSSEKKSNVCLSAPSDVLAKLEELHPGQKHMVLIRMGKKATELTKSYKNWEKHVGHTDAWIFPCVSKGVLVYNRYDGIHNNQHVFKITDITWLDTPNKHQIIEDMTKKRRRRRRSIITTLAILAALATFFESLSAVSDSLIALITLLLVDLTGK